MTRIYDGYQTLIACSLDANVVFYEKTLQPPAVQGGGAIDATTMHNTLFRTQIHKTLVSVGDAKAMCAYDPAVYNEIMAMVNKNQQFTVSFPDGTVLIWRGWIDEFTPQDLVEGEQPLAEIIFKPSNLDGTLAGEDLIEDAGSLTIV